jgi:O-antigen/teichoic acid export membrane protein
MEFLAVLSQFLIFEVMRRFFSLSISVSLFLGFIVSYSIISILLVKNLDFYLMKTLKLNNPIFFWKLTRGNHTVGVSIAILDRLDKIFIAYFFPIGALAPYSILCSLISTLRFIPDYASRLIISYNISSFSKFSKYKFLILTFSIPAFFLFAVFSQKLIVFFLGDEWILPLSIGFFVAVQEFTRAFFQVQLNRLVLLERVLWKKYIPLLSVFLTFVSVYLLANWVGLIGVPIAFSIVYGVTSVLTLLGGRRWSNP